jgi:trimeric autotransporter adhesin
MLCLKKCGPAGFFFKPPPFSAYAIQTSFEVNDPVVWPDPLLITQTKFMERHQPYRILWIPVAVLLLATSLATQAQNVAINTDGSRANPNAMLDIQSNSKGLLIPRLTTVSRMRIPHTQGLLVYDINTNSFWYNTGRSWQNLYPSSISAHAVADSAWLLTGNSATIDGTNFLGTTDNVPFNIRVNNQPSGRIDHLRNNTFWGFRAGLSATTGRYNTGYGEGALYSNQVTEGNTATGFEALYSNTQGWYNTAAGFGALRANVNGGNNTAVGGFALHSNTSGSVNTALGYRALYANAGGAHNTATGMDALAANINGVYNTANGAEAMALNTTGTRNTATGYGALRHNTSGFDNTAIGMWAMYSNTDGWWNTASGNFALQNNTTGFINTAAGYWAMVQNTSGTRNVAMGYLAMLSNVTGSDNVAIGAASNVFPGNLFNATVIGGGATVNASNKVRIGNSSVTVIEGQVPFSTPSDGRFKFAVQEDVKGLDFILQLKPVTYQFNVEAYDESLSPKQHLLLPKQAGMAADPAYELRKQEGYKQASSIRRSGFIAQQVEKAAESTGYQFSGLIKPKNATDHYSLSYDAFVVPLVKAVQEQQQVIAEQNKKIETLQQQLDEIKKLLQRSNQ